MPVVPSPGAAGGLGPGPAEVAVTRGIKPRARGGSPSSPAPQQHPSIPVGCPSVPSATTLDEPPGLGLPRPRSPGRWRSSESSPGSGASPQAGPYPAPCTPGSPAGPPAAGATFSEPAQVSAERGQGWEPGLESCPEPLPCFDWAQHPAQPPWGWGTAPHSTGGASPSPCPGLRSRPGMNNSQQSPGRGWGAPAAAPWHPRGGPEGCWCIPAPEAPRYPPGPVATATPAPSAAMPA